MTENSEVRSALVVTPSTPARDLPIAANGAAQASAASSTDGEHLTANIVMFGRFLRRHGLKVDTGRQLELVKALSHIDLRRRIDFREAARAVVVTRRDENRLFDRAFTKFWQAIKGDTDLLNELPRELLDSAPTGDETDDDMVDAETTAKQREVTVWQVDEGDMEGEAGDEGDESDPDGNQKVVTYSAVEVLRQKDFADCSEEEIAQARRLMRRMRLHFGFRRTRRAKRSHQQRRFDPRQTLRKGGRYGWELLRPQWRAPQKKLRPVVVICDISGSMERYSRLLLHFCFALQHRARHVESFVFGTRLTRITRQLRYGQVDLAIQRVAEEVIDWSGGTRIGESLGAFNRVWARRVLGRGAVVIVISDGWDRGDVNLLRRELARLQRSCHRLIWLNPLLGSPEYQPLTQGIVAALDYVDDFLPAHSLTSLEQLASSLAKMSDNRPSRAQRIA